MKLSIIVPVYNMASDQKLNHCIDSLLAQTVEDYEIIAVDDCSTDDSLKLLREYESANPEKMRVFASPVNLHQGGAKNIGISKARGEWIGFIDADDWVSPCMYEKLLSKAETLKADMAGCTCTLVDEYTFTPGTAVPCIESECEGVLDHEKKGKLILDAGYMVLKIFKRSLIVEKQLLFPEGIFYEDNAMSNSFCVLNGCFAFVNEPMYFYYQHDTSTVHTITERRCSDRMEAGRIILREAERHGFFEEFSSEIEFQFTQLFYINTLFSYMPGVKRTKPSFVKALGDEMKRTFPKFRENPYYEKRVHPEEKKLIDMQLSNTLFFMLYYKLLWFYRKLRKKLE